jgi:hypothetical protein
MEVSTPYLTYRRCDATRHYISPIAQNLRSNLSSYTENGLVKFSQFGPIDAEDTQQGILDDSPAGISSPTLFISLVTIAHRL